MKTQIIFLFLLIVHCSSWSQNGMPTDGPCTNDMLLKVKGKWIKSSDLGESNSPNYKAQQQEAYKRLDEIHNMVLKIYPQPIAVDAVWHRSIGLSYFGTGRKYYTNRDDVLTFDYSNLPSFTRYYYRCGFFAYYCGNGNFMWPGHTNETGTWLTITTNSIEGCVGDLAGNDTWTINGLPVRTRNPVLKKIWNDYELQHSEPGSNGRYVLIHRKGLLPYLPVTRKQYLDYCLVYTAQLHDKMIEGVKQIPVRSLEEQEKEKKARLAKYEKDFGSDPKRAKSAIDYYLSGYQTDQQRRDEQVKVQIKNKEDVLKHYQDELEKTTKEGLLDSPAIVRLFHSPDAQTPVFAKETEGGSMLVTENPAYLKKDLPKYVPQFMVFFWSWSSNPPEKKLGEIVEANFPIERLQAMIDK